MILIILKVIKHLFDMKEKKELALMYYILRLERSANMYDNMANDLRMRADRLNMFKEKKVFYKQTKIGFKK